MSDNEVEAPVPILHPKYANKNQVADPAPAAEVVAEVAAEVAAEVPAEEAPAVTAEEPKETTENKPEEKTEGGAKKDEKDVKETRSEDKSDRPNKKRKTESNAKFDPSILPESNDADEIRKQVSFIH